MRFSTCCLMFAALLIATSAAAQGGGGCSFSCNNQRTACELNADFQLSQCFSTCDQLYTKFSPQWTACRNNCQAAAGQRMEACYYQWVFCMDSCPEGQDPGNCPIVIDLGQPSLDFTSAAAGVYFDLDADGAPDALAWTDAGGGDGFLALDRDGNGRIDSGRELFGNHTVQRSSEDPNGFRALALYDVSGDGVISSDDPVWSSLRIWVDANHNGVSEDGELAPLGAYAIRAIDLTYRESRRRDRHGNELRYSSQVLRDGAPPTFAVDVFLEDED